MYVYIGLLIILFLEAIVHNKVTSGSAKLYISIAMIYLLMALKAPVAGDYSGYVANFINAAYRTVKEMASYKGEIGFHAFTKAVTYITDNPIIYFAITAAFICIALGVFIKRYAPTKSYAVYFYYTIGLFAFSMAGLRQVLAMSICLFAYEAIKKKRIILFLAIVGIAFLFHKSAIFFLPAYPIARFQWKWKNFYIALTSYALICIMFIKLHTYIALWLGYENYTIERTGNGGIFMAVLIIIGLLSIIYKDKLLSLDRNNIIFINLHFAAIALWPFRLLTRTVERPIFFYLYATIILLDKILSLKFDDDSQNRVHKIIIFSSLLLFGLLFLYRLASNRNLIPYILI